MPTSPTFFSNCREWDSYVVFHNLVESDRCEELPPETTREGAFSRPDGAKLHAVAALELIALDPTTTTSRPSSSFDIAFWA